jgi:hypothetical protein
MNLAQNVAPGLRDLPIHSSKGSLAFDPVPAPTFSLACASRFPGRSFCLPDPVAQSVQLAELKIEVGCVLEED